MPAITSRPLRAVSAVLATCALAIGLASVPAAAPVAAAPPVAASAPAPIKVADACDQTPAPGHFSCFAQRRIDAASTARRQLKAATAANPPSGYGPTDLQSAYALAQAAAGNGSDQTVYIVDAYDDPKAEADLAVYRSTYGLPACTSANHCFRKLNQNGQTGPLPTADEGWAGEIALDLAMVSAVCPLCKITLVEANDNGESLFVAVKRATTLGAKFVSLSWGGGEDGSEPSYDNQYFQPTGVVYTAASGDDAYDAGVSYPASSPRVVAVGGTHLSRTSSTPRGWTESVWNNLSGGTGSGCSASEAKPAWQSVIATSTCAKRAITDVSAVADPATGVAVYFTYDQGSSAGWSVFGGTSASAPIIAATYALAGAPSTDRHPGALPYVDRSDLNDVTSGSNGTCAKASLCRAGTGWDGPTGLGTPNGLDAFTSDDDAANTVSLTNPGSRGGNDGRALRLQIAAHDSGDAPLTFQASGLPAGLAIDASSGLITGTPTASGSRSVSVTAADATGATNSVTFTWTIAAACALKLTNSGFESGRTGWTMSSNRVFRSKLAHHGTHYARLDGYGRTHTDRVSRAVTIPAGCKAVVHYYLRISSADKTKAAHDKLTVAVNGATRQTFSNLSSKHYVRRTMDATRYAGKKITISWTGRENSSRATAFYLDDITVSLS
jgi:hypothetical protein